MFSIYQKLFLALKKVQMVKSAPPQVLTTQYPSSAHQSFRFPLFLIPPLLFGKPSILSEPLLRILIKMIDVLHKVFF